MTGTYSSDMPSLSRSMKDGKEMCVAPKEHLKKNKKLKKRSKILIQ